MTTPDDSAVKKERHYPLVDAAALVGISAAMLKEAIADRELEHRAFFGPSGKCTKRVIAESELWRWFYARTKRIVRAGAAG